MIEKIHTLQEEIEKNRGEVNKAHFCIITDDVLFKQALGKPITFDGKEIGKIIDVKEIEDNKLQVVFETSASECV